MAIITFVSKHRKNKGLIINSSELLSLYFYGIDISSYQGTILNPESIDTFIRSAQAEIESVLCIKVLKQLILERSDYYKNEFTFNGFIKCKLPVNTPISIEGKFGDQTVAKYPAHWLTVNKSSTFVAARQIVLVPNSNISEQSLSNAMFGATSMATMGLHTRDQIGSYWSIKYITGWSHEEVPFDIINLIGKVAAVGLFNVIGDIILGKPGVSNYSVSIDGLSQSIGTSVSGTNSAFGGRLTSYKSEIKETVEYLKGVHRGVIFTAM